MTRLCGEGAVIRGCAEYTDIDAFPDEIAEHPVALNGLIEPHLLGCVLARPLTYLIDRDAGTSSVNGLIVQDIPHTAAALYWSWVVDSGAAAYSLEDYQESLRLAAGKVAALCDAGDAPPCTVGVDEAFFAMQAFWGAGFWSARFAPSDLAPLRPDARRDYQATGGVAASSLEGVLGAQMLLVFVDAVSDRLRISGVSDPTSMTLWPPSQDLLIDGGPERAGGDPAIAVDTAASTVYVAFRDRFTSELRVARGGLTTPFVSDSRFQREPIGGSPALAVHDGDVFVAARSTETGRMHIWVNGARLDVDTEDGEHDPFLLSAPPHGLFLFTADGPRQVCEPTPGGAATCVDGAHMQVSRRWVDSGSRFAARNELRRLPLRLGLGEGPGLNETVGAHVIGRVDGVGPTAAMFGGRAHLFWPSLGGELLLGTSAHFSFVPGPTSAPVSRSESRVTGGHIGNDTRLAAVSFPSPSLGDVLLLIGNTGGRIEVSYRLAQ